MASPPKVTVVIPAHNEERYIQSTIASVRQQEFPSENIHVVVVDNNSTDRTNQLAKDAGAQVVFCPAGKKVGAVRNLGVASDQGDILAFIDGDCDAPPSWIKTAVEKLSDPSIGAVGGPCLLPSETTWVERAFVGVPKLRDGETTNLAGSSMIMRRRDFEAIGGFSETLNAGEDDELSARVRAAGFKILALKDCAVVHHGYPKTLKQIFYKQLWHGKNQLEAAESWRDPTLVVTHTFLLCMLGILASLLLTKFWLTVFFVCGAIFLAGVFTAAKLAKSKGDKKRFIPLTVVHVVYLLSRSIALTRNYQRKFINRKF